jgi:hypothetical protein
VLPLPQIGKRLKELAGVAEAAADDAALGARPGPMGRTAPGLE